MRSVNLKRSSLGMMLGVSARFMCGDELLQRCEAALPRSQQQKITALLEPFIAHHAGQ
jgi:hypothetical protein